MSATGPGTPLRVSRVLSHLTVMGIIAVVLGVLVAGLAVPFAGVLGLGARDVTRSLDDLPATLKTAALPQKTRILDAKGNLIASIYDENRVNVSLAQISPVMRKAMVSIEDYRFYKHGALDLKGTLRAMVTNQARGGAVQGGSSITQQLVKLTLLQEAGDDKAAQKEAVDDSYARKIRELRYAIALEREHTKDWILERYLNTAYFGDGAFGVQAAARHYFDVNAKDLNLRQAAMLAGLVKNPTGYDPTNNADAALLRRNTVINRMAQLRAVPQAKADNAKATPLGLEVTRTSNGCTQSPAPFFCEYVRRYLLSDPALGATRKERDRLIQTGGLTIRTTLDQRFQAAATQSVADHVRARESVIGSLAMVQPGTGEVRAIAQSRPMGTDVKQGQTFLNYAVPKEYGDANGFQPGSTFKVFVLATAIEQGLPLDTIIDSPATKAIPENSYRVCGDKPYSSTEIWDVPNSTTSGRKNLYSGTRESVNTFFAQLEQQTGLCEPYRLAKAMGISLTNRAGEMVPSFTLGVADVSPVEMAGAYATFAARGLHCDVRPVTAIQDARGRTLRTYKPQCTQVMKQTTADAVNDILSGVINGGFASAQALGRDAAGKTGTTNSQKSVWFAGYTPDLATSAVVAGVNAAGAPDSLIGKSIGGSPQFSISGSGTAAPLWGQAMRGVLSYLPVADFVYPSTVPGAGVTVVPPPKKPNKGKGKGKGNNKPGADGAATPGGGNGGGRPGPG